MNSAGSSTWKNHRNRYIVGIGGAALALSIAIGGMSSLPSSGSREASVTPRTAAPQSANIQDVLDSLPQLAGQSFEYSVPAALRFDAIEWVHAQVVPVEYSVPVALQFDSVDWVQSLLLPPGKARVGSP
jgi:hypothetical protein